MDIKREVEGDRGHYVTTVDGKVAKLVFETAGKTLVINHVGVPKELEGRGIGSMLVQRAVEDARANGQYIVPVCPFAKKKIEQNPDWQDVLSIV